MSNPESHTSSNEENEAYERWKVFYGEEMLGEPTPEPTEPEPADPYEQYIDAIEDATERHHEVEEYQADMKEAADELDANEPQFNKVEIGEINIKGIVQDIGEQITAEQIQNKREELDNLTSQLSELYAKNRNLVTYPEHRTDFEQVRGEYGKILDEFLRLKGDKTYREGRQEIADKLDAEFEKLCNEVKAKLTEFAGGDIEHTQKTQEELDAEKAKLVDWAQEELDAKYGQLMLGLEGKVNADFVNDFIAEESNLEAATIDALKNGNIARKFIDRVLNNKALRVGLGVAAVAGLAAAGIGMAAGTISIGISSGFGLANIAGAAKGAVMGTIMSRQSAEKSAINGLASEEEIRENLRSINIVDPADDSKNVATWLLDRLEDANAKDKAANIKRTAISAGLGALAGGIMSNIKVNNIVEGEAPAREVISREPYVTKYEPKLIDQVDIPQGHGYGTTFEQLGGNPEDFEKATEIMLEVGKKHGFERVNNPLVVDGPFVITHPGKISTWPADAQSFTTEVAKAWANEGLISRNIVNTGGAPIYGPITRAAIKEVPSAFKEFILRGIGEFSAATLGNKIDDHLQAAEAGPIAEPEPPVASPEVAPEPDAYNELKESFAKWGVAKRIGAEGVEFITAKPAALTTELTEQFTAYWNNLNDDNKSLIKKLVYSVQASLPVKNAFAEWLTNEGEI